MKINQKESEIIKSALDLYRKTLSENLGRAFARKDQGHIEEIRSHLAGLQNVINKF